MVGKWGFVIVRKSARIFVATQQKIASSFIPRNDDKITITRENPIMMIKSHNKSNLTNFIKQKYLVTNVSL